MVTETVPSDFEPQPWLRAYSKTELQWLAQQLHDRNTALQIQNRAIRARLEQYDHRERQGTMTPRTFTVPEREPIEIPITAKAVDLHSRTVVEVRIGTHHRMHLSTDQARGLLHELVGAISAAGTGHALTAADGSPEEPLPTTLAEAE